MKDRAKREEALAKLAAPLLRRDGEALNQACPGADVVAGYLDRSLDAAERSRCEVHFAACARCQGVLAGLARIEAPAPVPRPEKSPAAVWPWTLNWRWLAPAAAILVVGVTIAIVRQSLEPSLGPRVMTTPPTTVAGGTGSEVEAEALKKMQPPRPAKDAERRADESPPIRQAAAKPVPSETAGGERTRETPAAPAPVVAQNLAMDQPKVTVAERVAPETPAGAAKPVATAAAAAPPVPPAAVEPQARARRAEATQLMGAAVAGRPPTLVPSPSPAVFWRIGSAGSIERSLDAGRSWERQAGGVRTALVAGSAPAETICWVVGVQGTILRTTDGRTWQVVSLPTPVDLVSVSALDDLVATVVAADGRQFTTSDGGRTWRAP